MNKNIFEGQCINIFWEIRSRESLSEFEFSQDNTWTQQDVSREVIEEE